MLNVSELKNVILELFSQLKNSNTRTSSHLEVIFCVLLNCRVVILDKGCFLEICIESNIVRLPIALSFLYNTQIKNQLKEWKC